MSSFRPTLHVSILSLFMIFLVVSAGTLTWFNYNKNSQAALEIAGQLMDEVNGKVLQRIDSMFGSIFRLTIDATELPQLARKPRFMRHEVQWFLAESLLDREFLYSMYIGYADGDFYQIISLGHAGRDLREKWDVPAGARLAVRRVFSRPLDGRRVELWQFFDAERRMVGSHAEKTTSFDPRTRPWFKRAIDVEGVVQTPFYVFTSTETLGMTVARRFDGPVPGVFGVDITLDELSAFFAEQRVGESGFAFMFDGRGRLTAYPDPGKTVFMHSYRMGQTLEQTPLDAADDPLLADLGGRLKAGGVREHMTFEGEYGKYLVHVTPVRDRRLGDQYVAVAARVSDFTGSMDQTRRTSLVFALIIGLLAIPVAMYFSRLISRPLKKLAHEADEIRRFRLESAVDVESNIAEIVNLTRAVKTMKSSLHTFGLYVPKALVSRILQSDVEVRLGGVRRELTLLFTDIADFTALSENMNPEELLGGMSDYLQVVGSEILDRAGTIDKFIGDSVMAFWNAPVRQERHAALACEAVLRAQRANQELNRRREVDGLPPLHTRFGLHTGEAIVGNVGSADRMNYTAMGATVNLASRLEGLNKHYGTEILASEAVRDRAGSEFIFRTVGMVRAKGTTRPVKVYELLGTVCDIPELAACDLRCAHVEVWEQAQAAYMGRRFDEAARLFAQVAEREPEDGLAFLMAEKALGYQADPPGPDWDGVDAFEIK